MTWLTIIFGTIQFTFKKMFFLISSLSQTLNNNIAFKHSWNQKFQRVANWLFPGFGFWLGSEYFSPEFLSLVGIRLNGLAGVIKCYVHIPVDLCDLMNPLFDTFGSPISPQGFDCRIVDCLVKPFPFFYCDLVLVPWTYDAQTSIKVLMVGQHEHD